MRGYKIATHATRACSFDDIDSPRFYDAEKQKVLVILDIPDGVKRTTPEIRYSKIPSGLTTVEFNEWNNEAQMYYTLSKKYADIDKLFRDYKNIVNKLVVRPDHFDSRYKISDYKFYIHVVKCRAAEANVIKIIDLTDGTPHDCADSDFDSFTTYRTGETVMPDAYTDDYLDICAHGIHYFESPWVAMLYHARTLSLPEARVFLYQAEGLLETLRKEGDI